MKSCVASPFGHGEGAREHGSMWSGDPIISGKLQARDPWFEQWCFFFLLRGGRGNRSDCLVKRGGGRWRSGWGGPVRSQRRKR